MEEIERAHARVLMKEGQWLVPPEERPAGWEELMRPKVVAPEKVRRVYGARKRELPQLIPSINPPGAIAAEVVIETIPPRPPKVETCLCGNALNHRGRCKVREIRKRSQAWADANCGPGSHAGIFVIAAVLSGKLDAKWLAQVVDISVMEARRFEKYLRRNECWTKTGKIGISFDWDDKKANELFTVEMIMHVLVAEGTVCRVSGVEQAARDRGVL